MSRRASTVVVDDQADRKARQGDDAVALWSTNVHAAGWM